MTKIKMPEGKVTGGEEGAEGERPVLALKLDAKTKEPVEVTSDGEPAFMTPCSISGAGAGLSGGMLGYVFGFGGYWMRNGLKGKLKESLASGWDSGKTFAIMGGLYAAVTCFAKRIRQKEDGWNGAAAGCATGLALGWGGGPQSALQSCALFGIFSYFIDGMGGGAAQAAAAGSGGHAALSAPPPCSFQAGSTGAGQEGSWVPELAAREASEHAGASQQLKELLGQGDGPWPWPTRGCREGQPPQQWLEAAARQLAQHVQQAGHVQRSRHAVRQLLSPALPLLSAMSPCQFGYQHEGVPGCRVLRRR